MKAAMFRSFNGPLAIEEVPDPTPHDDAAVVRVEACGLCRSDWHGWKGHDSDVGLPHVPGHELAGEIVATGRSVRHRRCGERVTVPFCCGCGSCRECTSGNPHICDRYTQPGFTHWGAFAELVELRFADVNLVPIPESVPSEVAASLGCRFTTAFRGIADVADLRPGEFVAVHGCGGVGLSAIMIAAAVGGIPIAVDINPEQLRLAESLGAVHILNAAETEDIPTAIRDLTEGGCHVSVDALGSHVTCRNSVRCLRKRGRHVQIGLLLGDQRDPPVPMDAVIAGELQILGSHGMQADRFERVFRMIENGRLTPERLISRRLSLTEAAQRLPQMGEFRHHGTEIITQFSN